MNFYTKYSYFAQKDIDLPIYYNSWHGFKKHNFFLNLIVFTTYSGWEKKLPPSELVATSYDPSKFFFCKKWVFRVKVQTSEKPCELSIKKYNALIIV